MEKLDTCSLFKFYHVNVQGGRNDIYLWEAHTIVHSALVNQGVWRNVVYSVEVPKLEEALASIPPQFHPPCECGLGFPLPGKEHF